MSSSCSRTTSPSSACGPTCTASRSLNGAAGGGMQHRAADRADQCAAHEVLLHLPQQLRADLGAILDQAGERAVDDVAARGDAQSGDNAGILVDMTVSRRVPAQGERRSACRSSTGQSGPCAMRHCLRGSTLQRRGHDRIDPEAAQRARPASARAARRAAAAMPAPAARRCAAGRAGVAASKASHAPPRGSRARAGVPRRRLRASAPGPRHAPAPSSAARASVGVGQDGLALRRPVTFDQRQQRLPRGVRSVMLPCPVARAGAPRDPAAEPRPAHPARSAPAAAAPAAPRAFAPRRCAPPPPRTPAPAAPVRAPRRMPRRPRRRRHAHLHARQPVSGRRHFVAKVDRRVHHARRLRIRMDTMRP